jgi:hypothetical protein
MKETLIIEVTVHIDYNEGQREEAISAALDCVLASAITGSNYTIEPVESKALYTSPILELTVANCKFYDLAQGRHKCTFHGFHPATCHGICKEFKQK